MTCEHFRARWSPSIATTPPAHTNAPNSSPTVLRPRRLVGRDSEIRDVSESVTSAPVTTLLGPGGVGKTVLAITVAAACSRDFPGGSTVVWLGSLPRSGGQSYEDALTHWLTDRDVLLLIDNCEHVVSAVADLVDGLTARLPRLRVLATSREPLWIDGEVTYRLAPLSVVGPDASLEEVAASTAVQLFRERAGARARGALDTERACRLFGEICRRVDGLPLAIELAAARVAGLDPEDIASHLDDLFTLLPQPAWRADGAQRSLHATVEWSDALLGEEERRLSATSQLPPQDETQPSNTTLRPPTRPLGRRDHAHPRRHEEGSIAPLRIGGALT